MSRIAREVEDSAPAPGVVVHNDDSRKVGNQLRRIAMTNDGTDSDRDAWGMDRFHYLPEHPAEARIFDAFMANFPDRRHRTRAVSYDFSGAKLIVDIGGGDAEALRQAQSTRGGFRSRRHRSCHTAGSTIGRKDRSPRRQFV
ncbi:hypothetical protein WKW77_33780 [Variovorax ureilyticus]|uniref:Uncharacterized protein n=1 Tax=Variovorax ureilyticus TaxID=1836198 RepID=A0ABU8VQW6_9BURK